LTDSKNLTIRYNAMRKEIRSWGYWLIGLGLMHIILFKFLSVPWGIISLLLGLSSFYFVSPPIFIVFAVNLFWIAILNATTLNLWILMSVIQLYFSFLVFKKYFQYRDLGKPECTSKGDFREITKNNQRTARIFPWIGSSLGCLPIVLFITGSFFFTVLTQENGETQAPSALYNNFIETLIFFSMLGFSFSLASIISKYRPKFLGLAGIIGGSFSMIFIVILIFI